MMIADFIADGVSYGSKRAVATAEAQITIRLYLPRKYGAVQVGLVMHKDQEDDKTYYEMEWEDRAEDMDLYALSLCAPETGLYWYSFELVSGDTWMWSHFENRRLIFTEDYEEKNETQLTIYERAYEAPSYLGGGVIYQIFPDRFYRGSNSLPLKDVYEKDSVKSRYHLRQYNESYDNQAERSVVLRDDWGGEPIWWMDRHGEMLNNDFFGGNLAGVREKLPYLKKLGVTCIYLGPIFEAYSNHKYDTGNYMKIDASFGTEEDFKALCKDAKKLGMAVMLDGVFNHTGADSIYFNKYGIYDHQGVWQGDDTYRDWFDIENGKYLTWWGIETLPTVKKNSASHREYLFGEDGVIRKWIRLGASGWRLDVVDELPTDILQELTSAAKAEKRDAIVLGEVWEDASNKIAYGVRRSYFQGKELDSVMNYPWKDAILSYLKDGNAAGLGNAVDEICCNYPPEVLSCLMNVISTHDSVRALTMLGTEGNLPANRDEMSKTNLSKEALLRAKRLLELASLIQMTLPGVPSIYYGDEAGMEGFIDPFNRRCFPWDQIDEKLFTWYCHLTKMRTKYRSFFANADCKVLCTENGLFAFVRSDGQQSMMVIVNRSAKPVQITLNGKWKQTVPQIRKITYSKSKTNAVLEGEYGCLTLFGEAKTVEFEWEQE